MSSDHTTPPGNDFRWALLSPDDTVLAAVSGGPDSLCLLHLLWTHREARKLGRVEAAHLDHGLRGDESAAEAAWVADWCRERGISCHLESVDVAVLARKTGRSKQQAAREARYAFLSKTAERVGADKIATGHTLDDQTETVLAHILRGSGTDGLRGIPERRGMIIRPLLGVSRQEIEAYCAAHGLTPRQDSSNLSSEHYTRNRIRLELLPQLRCEYNARVDEALLRLSAIAERDSDYLAAQAKSALADAVRAGSKGRLELDRAALAALHPALLRYVLRQAIETVRGTSEGISHDYLERVSQAVVTHSPHGFALMCPYPTCTAEVAAQTVNFWTAADEDEQRCCSAPLPVPGVAMLNSIGWTVQAAWEDHPGAVQMDADAVDLGTLVVRSRRDGDRVDPLGMKGRHKKVSDLFTDAKVPRSQRHRIPIVANSRGIVWVAGHTLAEQVKVTPQTTRRLFISAHRIDRSETDAGN